MEDTRARPCPFGNKGGDKLKFLTDIVDVLVSFIKIVVEATIRCFTEYLKELRRIIKK